MSVALVAIRELAGWTFDNYPYRPDSIDPDKLDRASRIVAARSSFEQDGVLLDTRPSIDHDLLASHAHRPDLHAEMTGLQWSLGIVDLRFLIAFQRRLSFRPDAPPPTIPARNDWSALVALAFGTSGPIEYERTYDPTTRTLVLQSNNPNLHIATTSNNESPLTIRTAGPFFEVACLRGRWFLRDGYHRAYALLQAEIYEVPAVIVQTTTLEELGASQPWFFPEDILFSNSPPRLVDFLGDDLVVEYDRPALIKTLRITFEETLAPATPRRTT